MDIAHAIDERFGICQRYGNEVVIVCPHPDHNDNSPSCWVNIEKGLWVCYSCGAGGKVTDLIGGYFEYIPDLDELVEMLEEMDNQFGYLPEAWLKQYTMWSQGRDYWCGTRGLSEATYARFKLGWDVESDAATYPFRLSSGELVGVVRRFMEGRPKYKYPSGYPIHSLLFGMDQVRAERARVIVLTEGAMDAMAFWDVGIPAVAQYGGTFSLSQENILAAYQPRQLILCHDNDAPGRKATDQVVMSSLAYRVDLRAVTWDGWDYKDPADVPPDRRQELIDSAVDMFDFLG